MMDFKVTTLDGKEAGSVTLDKDIFGLEPREDLIQRCVVWQLRSAARHAQGQDRAEISLTGKKSGPQKGSGGARHGSRLRTCSAAAAVRSVRIRATIRSICRRRCGLWRCAMRFPPRRRTATSSSSTPSR